MGSFSHTIKQVEDKNVANEINHMVWSDRMDLVAFSNVKGEVAFHRLTWTKAWSLNPLKEELTVNGLAWRPDGKVLAIAYSSGDIVLVDIEARAHIYQFTLKCPVSFMSWIRKVEEPKTSDVPSHLGEELMNLLMFVDHTKTYVRDPPPVYHMDDAVHFDEVRYFESFLQDQSEFNMIIFGTKDGHVLIKLFGCWTCVVIDIKKHVGRMCSVENVHMTDDLGKMFVTIKDEDENVKVLVLDSDIFESNTSELYGVAMKYIKLYELIMYLGRIMTCIIEQWESILLEFDKKLSVYATKAPEGGVTADFVEFLVTGVCSSRMEEFLLHDLTKKGLEKIGHAIESSYLTILAYLFKHVMKFTQDATFYLSDLKGMARFEFQYGAIGLEETLIEDAIRSTGAYMIKAAELMQLINCSVINYKAFFRWLYVSLLTLMDEPVSPEIQKVSQQELDIIANFFLSFDKYGKGDLKEAKLITEKLGQYLVDAPLKVKSGLSEQQWCRFLDENPCLKNHRAILPFYAEKSLVQVFNEFKDNIMKVFDPTIDSISNQLTPIHTFNCFTNPTNCLRVCCTNVSKGNVLLSFVYPETQLYTLQVRFHPEKKLEASSGKLYFQQFLSQENDASGDSNYKILDVKSYSSSVISILLQECTKLRPGVILQFSVNAALEKMTEINPDVGMNEQEVPSANGSNLSPRLFKNIELPPSAFAVSGSRRVCIVLSENRRKVKLFEMEGEEDEDDDAEASSSVEKEGEDVMQE